MPFWDFKRSLGSVALMRELAQARGIADTALLRGSGISPAQLADPNVEIAAGRELKVMANFLRLSGAPARIGLELGLRFRHSTYGLWGYGLVSSATAQDALNMALRYLPLTYLFAQVTVRREGELAILQFHEPDFTLDLQRFVLERDMSAAAALLHELIGERFALKHCQLAVSETPGRGESAVASLFGASPQYAARNSQLAFEARLLDRRLPDANPITAAMCEQLCAELLRRRTRRGSEAQSVRQYLEVPGVRLPDLAGMARHLNTRIGRDSDEIAANLS